MLTSSKSRCISIFTVSAIKMSLPCSRPTHIRIRLKQFASASGSLPSTICNGWINGGKHPGRRSCLEYDLKTHDRYRTVCGRRILALWPISGRNDCSQRLRIEALSVMGMRSMLPKSICLSVLVWCCPRNSALGFWASCLYVWPVCWLRNTSSTGAVGASRWSPGPTDCPAGVTSAPLLGALAKTSWLGRAGNSQGRSRDWHLWQVGLSKLHRALAAVHCLHAFFLGGAGDLAFIPTADFGMTECNLSTLSTGRPYRHPVQGSFDGSCAFPERDVSSSLLHNPRNHVHSCKACGIRCWRNCGVSLAEFRSQIELLDALGMNASSRLGIGGKPH